MVTLQDYVASVRPICGGYYNPQDKSISYTYSNAGDIRRILSDLRLMQKRLRLLRKDAAQAKHEIHADAVDTRAHVGYGVTGGLASLFLGRRNAGKINALQRHALRQKELDESAGLVGFQRFIDGVLVLIDAAKADLQENLARFAPVPSQPDPHEAASRTLGVGEDAGPDEIVAAYRAKARDYHPDKVATLAPEFRDLATRKMKEINAAYQFLTAQG